MQLRNILFCVMLLIAVFSSGCAIKVSSQYAPSVLLDGEGTVNIKDFAYTPDGFEFDAATGKYFKASNDGKTRKFIEPYEVYTFSGLNPVYLDKSISEFVTDAVKKEFKFIGYKNLTDSHRIVGGSIKEVSIDYIGFSTIDYIVKVAFQISDGSNNIVYSNLSEGKYSTSKFTTTDLTSGLYTALAKSIESFVRLAQANGAL